MADTKISALPAASTPLTGSEVVPLNQSGVTSNVTVANLTAGRNITFNNTLPGYTTTATAAGTTTLTSNSTYHQRFTGSSAQTVVLPAATTMAQGQGFVIDNDSSGTLALQDGSAASLGSVTPGMAVYVFCENNSTTAGSWSGYMFVPGGGPSGQVTWGTSGLSMGGQTITNATWNGVTITVPYGGTGLTSLTAGYIPYGNGTNAFNSSSNLFWDGTNNRLGIGTSSPSVNLQIQAGSAPEIRITDGTNILQAYSDTTNGGAVIGVVNNAPLVFRTNATERIRLDISGNLLVGQTTQSYSTVGFSVLGSGSGSNNGTVNACLSGSTNTSSSYNLYSTGAGAFRFYVGMDGTIHATSTSITAISDASLKTNIKPLETGLAEINRLQPRRFDWLDQTVNEGTNIAGFISQEVQEVLPDLTPNFKYNETETKLGLKMGDMIPTMVKAIQELSAQVTALQTTVAALQTKVGV